MSMVMTPGELQGISNEIFEAVLGLVLEPVAHDEDFPADQRVMTAMVQITGDWTGAVTVEMPSELARTAAAIMFGMEPEEPEASDVRDTAGELANMAGGNVKSTLGGSCQLSLPSVTEGLSYEINVPGSKVSERVAFHCEGSLVVVAILERKV